MFTQQEWECVFSCGAAQGRIHEDKRTVHDRVTIQQEAMFVESQQWKRLIEHRMQYKVIIARGKDCPTYLDRASWRLRRRVIIDKVSARASASASSSGIRRTGKDKEAH